MAERLRRTLPCGVGTVWSIKGISNPQNWAVGLTTAISSVFMGGGSPIFEKAAALCSRAINRACWYMRNAVALWRWGIRLVICWLYVKCFVWFHFKCCRQFTLLCAHLHVYLLPPPLQKRFITGECALSKKSLAGTFIVQSAGWNVVPFQFHSHVA